MRSLFFLVLVVAAPLVLAAASGCDPDLGVTKSDGGPDAPAVSPGGDGGGPVTGDAGGDAPSADDGGDASAGTTHKIDGTNDFTANEKFPTTSLATGYEAYVTWDAKNMYFGM